LLITSRIPRDGDETLSRYSPPSVLKVGDI
jgi:hypothetical protein